MAKQIGVFVDVSNLYHVIGKKYGGKKLDYKKYLDFLKELGEIKIAIAYGAQIKHEAVGFIHCLKQLGYTPKYKNPKIVGPESRRKANWDVGMTIDIISMLDNLDIIVIGSADSDLAELVNYCKKKEKEVIILAASIATELRNSATQFIEIPESLLESTVKSQVLHTQSTIQSEEKK